MSVAVVLAADASRARLFVAERGSVSLRELGDLANPEARLHEGDLVADRGGRNGRRPMESGHSALGGGSMKEHRIEDFAARVCEQATRALREQQADRLYIVAEARFLGLLRQRLEKSVQKQVAGEVAKSLAGKAPAEIRQALPAQL
jgi:protein required for attachment to host cells